VVYYREMKAAGIFVRTKIRSPAAFICLEKKLTDGRRFTKMTFFHGHPPASPADVFHRSQFIFTHMPRIRFWSSTKTALGLISARVTQMSRLIGHRTAILTTISHDFSPFLLRAF
jgi:hypothetical protein